MKTESKGETFRNIEAEQIVLGGLMNNNDYIWKVADLKPETFYEPLHAEIFRLLRFFTEKGQAATPVTLKASLELGIHIDAYTEAGGANYLLRLTGMAGGLIHIVDYANILSELAAKRSFYLTTEKILKEMNMESDLSEAIVTITEAANENKNSFNFRNEGRVTKDIYDHLTEELPCFSTGLPTLDKVMLGGLHLKKTICIAAPQKVGKTITLGSISHNLSQAGVKHLFIAAEMGVEEILQRNVAHAIGRNAFAFYDEKTRADGAFQKKIADYSVQSKSPTLYLDAPSINFNRLKAVIISTVRRHKIKGVILDYLQIVTGREKGESEAEFQGRMAQALAEIAKKENIFILYAAQLNRDGQLRGSDGIKNAVDMLLFLQKSNTVGMETYRFMSMEASRYTIQIDCGDEINPAFKIDKHGPFLIEASG